MSRSFDGGPPDADNPMRGFGRPGGDWQGMSPTLDNPMTWAFPIGRVLRITVRVHVIFVIFVAIELLRSIVSADGGMGALSAGPMALALGALFVIVLLHEFGHCLACRRAGGEANEILMWPLGGLAFCRPPGRWRAHLITAVGGPAVNVVIAAILIPVLGIASGTWWGVAIDNPFSWSGLYVASQSWWLLSLYLVSQLNVVILLFNLLPVFPLDGGRILQAALWARLGYAPAMRIAVRVGYVGAILLGVTGFVTGNVMLVVIAVFGGLTCYVTHRQLEFTEQFMGFESEYAESLYARDEPRAGHEPPASRRAERRRLRREREQREVDDILRKIADSGMESLTGAEKRRLRRATRHRRQERRSSPKNG